MIFIFPAVNGEGGCLVLFKRDNDGVGAVEQARQLKEGGGTMIEKRRKKEKPKT